MLHKVAAAPARGRPACALATATIFTNSIHAVDAVSRTFKALHIVCEHSYVNVELSDAAAVLGVELHVVDSEDELRHEMIEADVGISFGCGLIFSRKTMSRFPAGIWNIHNGKLPEFRSRHAIGWAMIEGEREIGITVHQIDEQIDRGLLIYETSVPRYLWDTYADVAARCRAALPDVVREARRRFVAGDLCELGEGRYLPRIDRALADVEPSDIRGRSLFNLFLNEHSFDGVVVRGHRYHRCHFFREGICDGSDGGTIVTCKDGMKLVLYRD